MTERPHVPAALSPDQRAAGLYNRRTAISLAHSCFVRRSFVALYLVRPSTAMQPTCSVGAFLAFGGTFTLSRFSVSVPFCRTRLMANRWASVRRVA